MVTGGEIILSAFLQALFGRLLEMKSVAAHLDQEVDRLSKTLETVSVVLDNAERRQNEDSVKIWLQHLRAEVYEANDLLDEVAYEDLRRQHVKFQEVRNSFSKLSMRRWHFESTASETIIKIRERLDRTVFQSSVLNLREAPGNRGLIERTTSETSSVGHDIVFGREHDAHTILTLLLSNDFSKDNVEFISICGKAGLGKTTLAQVVFNDVSLAGHFHIKMWVHASDQDDNDIRSVRAIIKATIESITGKSCDLPNLDAMQHQLWQLLEQKKYLLVLDAMLNDRSGFLDVLKKVLMSAGANGSKVLITTPKRSISKLLHTVYTHELKSLSRDCCLEVMKKFAFFARNPEAHPDLMGIAEKVVDKCNGLPLAVKKYGMLLMGETERERWELISRKEVGEILELDYDVSQSLPSKMKRCFAYCSIFPNNFIFDKEQLVQQWLAQDFVPTEEKGSEYFDTMFQGSLFRYSHFDDTRSQQMYVMDDDIRSKAQLIAGEECFVMHHGNSHKISEMARHASFLWCSTKSSSLSWPSSSSNQIINNFEYLQKARGLYTLILFARMEVPKHLTMLPCLRTLDLSNTDLQALPDSISDLKHLRYLALNSTRIKRLPNSLSELYHLQSLGLRNCYELIELPKDMRYLTNLRHLDLHLDYDSVEYGGLRSMPGEIGKLTCLRTLSRFVVSKNRRCGVSELINMNDLHGNLTILNLEFVNSAEEARKANLERKEHLQMLDFRWGEDMQNSGIDVSVLDYLRPHANIKELKIGGYRGYSLSPWIGDPSFSSLVTMKLYNCKNLSKIPSLGQLPSLKKLHIESLPNWWNWYGNEDPNLPSLRELVIRNCSNLRQLSPTFPILMKLEIDRCLNIEGLPTFSPLHSLKVRDSSNRIWWSLPSLSSLSSLVISGMTAIPATELRACTNLWNLEISNCESLDFLPDDCLPSKLSYLKIEHCPRLQALPSGLSNLKDLSKLQVQDCEGLQFLPMGMKWLISLRSLELSCCPNLSSMPSDGLPAGLQILCINYCPKLNQYFQQSWGIIDTMPSSVWINGDLIKSSEASNSGTSTSKGKYSPYS